MVLRDRSLIKGMGLQKRGADGKGFSNAQEGGTKSFGLVLTRELELLAILKVRHYKFPPFKSVWGGGRREKGLPCLWGGGAQKVLNPRFPML